MKNGDELLFKETPQDGRETPDEAPWKLMVVDDENVVHTLSSMVLEGFHFQGRPLEIISAYSGEQARKLLREHPDTAVMLLDVVMETDDAGLRVVRYIRDELKNSHIRIILRTGQPGQAPENQIISEYDVNDYREKADLTAQKLVTSVTSALRAYSELQKLADAVKRVDQKVDTEFDDVRHAFLSRMSHELLTPMNAIMGFSQLLSLDDSNPLTEEQQNNLEQIIRSSEKLLELIGGLLELSELDAGRLDIELEEVNIRALIEESTALMDSLTRGKNIQLLSLSDAPCDYRVMGNKMRLQQVVLNLLLNAVKHSREGDSVLINCREADGGKLRVSVTDTGPGLSEEECKRLFEPFGLLDISSSGMGGLSISLAASKMILERMGGTLHVDSAPGSGSVFWFELSISGKVEA